MCKFKFLFVLTASPEGVGALLSAVAAQSVSKESFDVDSDEEGGP